MDQVIAESNRKLALEAFDALFNRKDYAQAERYWSVDYVQHSAHIPPGREGLFGLVRGLPETLKYESSLVLATDEFVMLHGRFSGFGTPAWIVVDILRIKNGLLMEHWDVIQDEATQTTSKSGTPMFGDSFPS